jgi:hypothetical protein
MKRAKFALLTVFILTLIGGALAFKAKRVLRAFFYYTTTIVGGSMTGACIIETQLPYFPSSIGPITLTLSHTSFIGVSTCRVRVVPNG